MVIKFIVFSFVLNSNVMEKETPLQWYVKWLWFIEDEYKHSSLSEEEYLDKKDGLFKKSLELERDEHNDTWDHAINTVEKRGFNSVRAYDDFDDYYDKIYKQHG